MRILFMGSAEFACPAVEALRVSGHDLVACVTQPDRPKGRHLKLTPCPVKALAEARGIPVLTPERVADPHVLASVEALRPDLIVVAAYGQYLPSRLLAMPRLACINIHPSLLPKYRGAAPIQWAVASGDTMTGVSILHVSKKMDSGDLILQASYPIGDEDTAGSLEPKLAEFGAELMLQAIAQVEQGTRGP
jgi:methionyl-tRNA formyltransferase